MSIAYIPIVMAAFGTGTDARNTFDFMDKIVKSEFPDHEIVWAYTSRSVRRKSADTLDDPKQALFRLEEKGCNWAVVQSLHFTGGHELHRLAEEVRGSRIRLSVGLPLLSSPEDYHKVIEALIPLFPSNLSREAAILIGHGTDHPSWSAYPALAYMIRERFDKGVYLGLVEDGYPTRDVVIKAVKQAGFRQVRLIPLMLTAGIHFQKDLMGNEDSWKSAFEAEGISVSAESKGLGFCKEIVQIFCDHIREAIAVIPG